MEDWKVFQQANPEPAEFNIFQASVDFLGAVQLCQEHNAVLGRISTLEEFEFVNEMFSEVFTELEISPGDNGPQLWIGMMFSPIFSFSFSFSLSFSFCWRNACV